ncbi:MAG: SOS response-associated peptidase [Acidobacteria bacterium]|nr:SOS response-associated peptidase [Acidobacteriota bacterium]MCA1641776.1 SOS response-associated peptidase [Acidobacteriota bacterium]
MCGRFTQYTPKKQIAEVFNLDPGGLFDLSPRYNIAPTQQVAAVGQTKDGRRKLAMLRWGLIPSWAREMPGGAKTFNARAETLQQRPTFRDALGLRRCLVIADGFYEWGKDKTPVYFYDSMGKPMAFAGLWDSWKSGEGKTINSCAIITTEANGLVKPVHDRMPAVLYPAEYGWWLDRDGTDAGELGKLLRPYQASLMKAHPVSKRVNDVRNDGEVCAAPLNLPLIT